VQFPSIFITRLMNVSQVQRQSVIAFGSTIAMTLIGFLATIYFAHMLGPAPLGAYFLFIAYFSIFNLVGDGGFGGAAVKRISEGNDQDEYFSAFVFIRIVLLALSITALLCAEPYLKDITSSGIFFWLLLALIISVFPNCASSGVYGSGKVGIHQVSGVVELLVRVLLQVTAVYLGYSVAGLVGDISHRKRFAYFRLHRHYPYQFFHECHGSRYLSHCTSACLCWIVRDTGIPDCTLSKDQQLGRSGAGHQN
jgi:O-antigen/teichoic acid export membrane protein